MAKKNAAKNVVVLSKKSQKNTVAKAQAVNVAKAKALNAVRPAPAKKAEGAVVNIFTVRVTGGQFRARFTVNARTITDAKAGAIQQAYKSFPELTRAHVELKAGRVWHKVVTLPAK